MTPCSLHLTQTQLLFAKWNVETLLAWKACGCGIATSEVTSYVLDGPVTRQFKHSCENCEFTKLLFHVFDLAMIIGAAFVCVTVARTQTGHPKKVVPHMIGLTFVPLNCYSQAAAHNPKSLVLLARRSWESDSCILSLLWPRTDTLLNTCDTCVILKCS